MKRLPDGERAAIYPDGVNDLDVSEQFSKYFIEKIDKIMDDIKDAIDNKGITMMDEELSVMSDEQFTSFRPLTTEEVRRLIGESKSSSCILDPIPTTLLKQCTDVLITPITDIINTSLRQGEFPSCWKCPIISPLLKSQGGTNTQEF